jgi:predicted TPR repeat methyltransferase
VTQDPQSPNSVTLATYEAAAARYAEHVPAVPSAPMSRFIEDVVELLPAAAAVLEVGSATGRDADLLEAKGLRVTRTDATEAFVTRLQARGLPARRLNVLTDDLGGPWDLLYASAVFLHFSAAELTGVLAKAAGAVVPGGVLAFTVKQGDGEGWTTAKLDRPRHFTYWRAPALRSLFESSAWEVHSLALVPGTPEDWLYVICRLPTGRAAGAPQ